MLRSSGVRRRIGVEAFQSLIGRLVTYPRTPELAQQVPFQSLIGRLVTDAREGRRRHRRRFQSLIGRLVTIDSNWIPTGSALVSIPYR